ncbi:MAG TPA: hypothetical protein VHY79_12925 [Rhizomicrobium sp.]|jgi:streptogramin lyase|nr:hypothetical protein [Rhizomicrobium sp.]
MNAWVSPFLYRSWPLFAAILAILPRAAECGNATIFRVPGSGVTEPTAINNAGDVTGWYEVQGFLRTANGTITTFSVPKSILTTPLSINASGAIAGWYFDKDYNGHGFIRNRDGTIETVELALSTEPQSINDKGVITG